VLPIPFLLPLLGGGIGALTNKNPLKGAAMGAGLGALGGLAAPMFGIGGAAAGGTGVTAGGLLGPGGTAGIAGPVGMGGSLGTGITASPGMGMGLASTQPGMGLVAGQEGLAAAAEPGLLTQLSEYAKPIGNAASAASAVSGLLGPSDMPMQQAPPMAQTGTGAQTLAQLVAQNQQGFDAQMQMAEQARAARRKQGFGGGLL
jgi:hypothetical protein